MDWGSESMIEAKNEIVVYQPNETIRLEVRLENETVWLNRHQMARLFGRDVKTIGKHIANALVEELSSTATADGISALAAPGASDFATTQHRQSATVAKSAQVEVLQNPTVAKFATVQREGSREVIRNVEYYGLDVILSVGYRTKLAAAEIPNLKARV